MPRQILPQELIDKALGRKPKVSEAHIQETCSQWLALDGWRRIRTDMKQLRGMGVQEPGMADDQYVRYWKGTINQLAMKPPYQSWAQVLWVEWKCKTGKALVHQLAWHEAERARGALTWISGIDFTASIEGFQDHYRKSGLRRDVR